MLTFRGAVSISLTSYVLSFKSYEFFKDQTERFSARMKIFSSRYVTEGGAKVPIRRFRNNDTAWSVFENSKAIRQIRVRSAKFFNSRGVSRVKNISIIINCR